MLERNNREALAISQKLFETTFSSLRGNYEVIDEAISGILFYEITTLLSVA
ncbi:hypothetical protein RFEPED_0159 [Rickettsia felis str. Pedreira]|uniref:Uncharacterized protein n=1 Tax=Rickettsia felis str. Pedreira TaxID=1359196 RepID=A0A0F3MQS1_RICFI|nr:hypothetical protein [Rickettsia felis]KJV57792.1 hypothetical protein RFEPED_0159 [Rickettsia felis str. Pedreira]MDE8610866.1 hypothetical protein [Rickettsia felis]